MAQPEESASAEPTSKMKASEKKDKNDKKNKKEKKVKVASDDAAGQEDNATGKAQAALQTVPEVTQQVPEKTDGKRPMAETEHAAVKKKKTEKVSRKANAGTGESPEKKRFKPVPDEEESGSDVGKEWVLGGGQERVRKNKYSTSIFLARP